MPFLGSLFCHESRLLGSACGLSGGLEEVLVWKIWEGEEEGRGKGGEKGREKGGGGGAEEGEKGGGGAREEAYMVRRLFSKPICGEKWFT